MKPKKEKLWYNGSTAKVEAFLGLQPVKKTDFVVLSIAPASDQPITAKGRTVK